MTFIVFSSFFTGLYQQILENTSFKFEGCHLLIAAKISLEDIPIVPSKKCIEEFYIFYIRFNDIQTFKV